MKTNFENFEFFTKYLGEMTKFKTLSDFGNIWYTSVFFYVEFRNEDKFYHFWHFHQIFLEKWPNFGENDQISSTLSDFSKIWHTSVFFEVEFRNEEHQY